MPSRQRYAPSQHTEESGRSNQRDQTFITGLRQSGVRQRVADSGDLNDRKDLPEEKDDGNETDDTEEALDRLQRDIHLEEINRDLLLNRARKGRIATEYYLKKVGPTKYLFLLSIL